MDTRTARWMEIKRLSPKELQRFHELESRGGAEHGVVQREGENAASPALAYLATINKCLGPYWDRTKLEDDRAREVASFADHVYPLWRGILAPENPKYETDLAALHAADRAIHADSYAINTHGGGPNASSRLSAVYGDGAAA